MARILIIDDDERLGFLLETGLEQIGFQAESVTSARKGLDYLDKHAVDLVLTDLQLPDASGLDVLSRISKDHPKLKVIMLTAFASVESAVEAMRSGAYDFVTKPLDMGELQLIVRRAIDHTRLEKENEHLKAKLGAETLEDNSLVAHSSAMSKILSLLHKIAPTESTVLLQGRSGTGKEVVARWIHDHSSRKDKPFVKVDCLTLPDPLLESELFGHAKGAFTGAEEAREGRISLAEGGTLFLDEIGDVPISTQVKLLRLLQDREYHPLGNRRSRSIDVRIITATNRDLEEAVTSRAFREDLYYRIRVVSLHLPRLCERVEDIPFLAKHFVDFFGAKHGQTPRPIGKRALRLLLQHDWPGNVRELEHAVEQALLVAEGKELAPDDFFNLPSLVPANPVPITNEPSPLFPDEEASLEDVERFQIARVLTLTGGNRVQAARILGIHRNTLRKKVHELGLQS